MTDVQCVRRQLMAVNPQGPVQEEMAELVQHSQAWVNFLALA